MKTIHIVLIFLYVGLFSSCEKVIDLNLKTSSSQIVIQGTIYDQPGPYKITISKSVGFDEPSIYPAVSGAIVTISDNTGISDSLTEDSAGVYVTSKLEGIPGRTYTLKVETDGQTYTASSTMYPAVEIDSIFIKNKFGKSTSINLLFKDPVDTLNYYRLVDFINDKKQPSIMASSDLGFDGKIMTGRVFYSEKDLKSGDTLTFWLESIDKGVYDYFRTASSSGGGQEASPANPVSNISNNALGFFSACSVRKRSFLMP